MIWVQLENDLVSAITERPTSPGVGWIAVVSSTPGVGEIQTEMPLKMTNLVRCVVGGSGLLIARTVSPEPTVTGNTVDIPPCVTGTVVTIDDGFETMIAETADVDGWTATYTLPDAGDYRVEVASPLPAVPTVKRLVVT